jgi:DNA-binding transcriptional ArsR family regulator
MPLAFAALAEPHRREILSVLRDGERSVGELVVLVGLSQPGVSKHLRVLREAGMVVARVDRQQRLYRLDPGPLREIDRWLEPYRRRWSASFDRLDDHLAATRRAARPTITGERSAP